MFSRNIKTLACLTCFVLLAVLQLPAADPPAPFTYQGYLEDARVPANGTYDLAFIPYETSISTKPVASEFYADDTVVTDGVFNVTLDFGTAVWESYNPWIEIMVRPGSVSNTSHDPATYTVLSPRQPFLPTHTAHLARDAQSVEGYTAAELLNANNINAGTLNTSRYSAFSDLQAEGAVMTSPTANKIPQADSSGKLDAGWLPSGTGESTIVRSYPSNTDSFGIQAGMPVSLVGGALYRGRYWTPRAETMSTAFATSSEFDIVGFSGNQALLAYRDEGDSNQGKLCVVTLSGGNLAVGDPVVFSTDAVGSIRLTIAPKDLNIGSPMFTIAFTNESSSGDLQLCGGKVSSTGTITLGTPTTVDAGPVTDFDVECAGARDFAIAWADPGSSNYGKVAMAYLATPSYAHDISTNLTFNSAATSVIEMGVISAQQIAIGFNDADSGGNFVLRKVAITGSDFDQITLGTKYDLGDAADWCLLAQIDTNVFGIWWYPSVSSAVVESLTITSDGFIVGTGDNVGGNAHAMASFGRGRFVTASEGVSSVRLYPFYLINNHAMQGDTAPSWLQTTGNTLRMASMGESNVVLVHSTGDAYISYGNLVAPMGIAVTSGSSGSSVDVVVKGIVDIFSSLSPGANYYVDVTGNLTMEPGWARIGRALSDSELLLDIE